MMFPIQIEMLKCFKVLLDNKNITSKQLFRTSLDNEKGNRRSRIVRICLRVSHRNT